MFFPHMKGKKTFDFFSFSTVLCTKHSKIFQFFERDEHCPPDRRDNAETETAVVQDMSCARSITESISDYSLTAFITIKLLCY